MSKDILQFVTPGPLTERFGFSARVFMSWISLGLVLGVIFGITGISAGIATATTPLALFVQSLLTFPLIICLFGLIGLGIDSMRGRNSEYDGWYWWLFPIVTYIVIGFWFAIAILGFCLALAGINLPSRPQQRQPKFNPEQFRREVESMKVEEILKEFDKQFEQVERKNQLDQEEKKVVKKIRGLDRSALRSQLQDALTDDELEILFILLLKILSGELG
jgi:uncharacterized membrane protein YhaH (DUF805 family)